MKKLILYFLALLFPILGKGQSPTYNLNGYSTSCDNPSTLTGTSCGINYNAGNIKLTNVYISGTTLFVTFNKCASGTLTGQAYLKMSGSSYIGDICCGGVMQEMYVSSASSVTLSADLSSQFVSGTKYFCITFTNSSNVRSYTKSFSVTAQPVSCTLTPPSSGSASSVTTNTFRANWNAVYGASSYTINMARINESYPGQQVTTTNLFYDFYNLDSDTQYKYQVRANCANGLSGNFGNTIDTPKTLATTPELTIQNNVNFSTQTLYTGISYNASFSVYNSGNGLWRGSMYLVLSNGKTIDAGYKTIPANSTANYTVSYTPISSEASTNISAIVKYQTNGTGNGISVPNQTNNLINIYNLNITGNAASPAQGIQNTTNFTFSATIDNVAPSPVEKPVVSIEFKAPDNQIYTVSDIANTSGNNYTKVKTLEQVGTYQYRYKVSQATRPPAYTNWQNLIVEEKAPITFGNIPSTMTWNCSQPIAWTSVSATGKISIELVNEAEQKIAILADGINNSGSFNWVVGKKWNGSHYGENIPSFVGNKYKLKIYPTGTSGKATLSNVFSINAPTVTVSSPSTNSYNKGENINIKWSTSSLCGNISIEYTDANGNNAVVIVTDTPNDGSHVWTIPSNLANGTYKIKIYVSVSSPPSPAVGLSSNFTIQSSPTCPTCMTGVTTSNFTTTGQEGFCASQYLCSQGVINKVQSNPQQKIIRGDLAKITYLSLLGRASTTKAESFPVPFVDLQNLYATDTNYYKYAKVLSYLEYQDGRSPFDRNRVNFNPNDTITRASILKVFLEAWNIDETAIKTEALPFSDVKTSHLFYAYIKKAHELGIITGSSGSFKPDVACSREEAFLMLYRLTQNTTITKPTLSQINEGFFLPGQYRPDNLSIGIGTDRGNFNHYTKTSFAIDGVVPLVFAHSYNSYATELPEQLYPNYMGRGWTHSFNCYVTTIGSGATLRMIVHYPDGKLHFYKQSGNTLVPESMGVYDAVATTLTSVTITTPSKITYYFEKVTGQSDNYWLIKSITDRNKNTLTFTNELGINNAVRLKSVSDPTGRTLNFVYLTGQTLNYLSEVNLSGVGEFNSRKIQFAYSASAWDGDGIKDLTSYKENDKNGTLKTTSYDYYTLQGSEHLLKTITLPKGNVISNTYYQRKLRSSQTLKDTKVVQQMNTNWTPDYKATAQGSTSAVTVSTGGTNPVTKTTNYTHNSNGLATRVKTTGTNPMDLKMDYELGNDPTSVTKIIQNSDSPTSTGVRIEYYPSAPYNVKLVKTAKAKGDSITQSYTYNSFNDIETFVNGNGNKTIFGYNATGNLTKITHPLGSPTTMERNNKGLITKTTTPAGISTNFTYNDYGNLLSTSTANGSSPAITSAATYDAMSKVVSKTDARNQSVSYQYYANDLLKRMDAPLSYYISYDYDANDNNTTITNAKGNATTNVYDQQTDQLMSRSFGGKTESFTYNEDGSLKTYTNGRGDVFNFTYDPSGRLTNDGYSTYSFNTDGTLNTVTHTQGTKTYTLDYDYDLLKRLNKTTCDGFAVQYEYDNNNNLTKITYPDGKTVTYTYDTKDRIISMTDWAGRVTVFTYDDDGKVLSYTLPNKAKANYTYDDAGRPKGISHQKSNNDVICAYTFTLDQGGNHTEENIIEPFTSLPTLTAGTTDYTNDARNQTTKAGSNTYTFDANGATTKQAEQSITWDIKDNLLTRNGITNYYDGNETRRAKTGKRYAINELSNSVIAETNEAGTYLYYYVYGPTGLLYRQNASTGAVEYYHYDFRGSTVAMTDDKQNIVRQYQYDAYGKILQQKPIATSDDNPFRYVGQYGVQYEDANLYFMRARYYDPNIGKFLSEDPIWSTNLYAYGDNNPIMFFDASGLKKESLLSLLSELSLTAYNVSVTAGKAEGTEKAKRAFQDEWIKYAVMKIIDSAGKIKGIKKSSSNFAASYANTIVSAFGDFIEEDKENGGYKWSNTPTSTQIVNTINNITVDTENFLVAQWLGDEIGSLVSPIVGETHTCVVEGIGYIADLFIGNPIVIGDCILNKSLKIK